MTQHNLLTFTLINMFYLDLCFCIHFTRNCHEISVLDKLVVNTSLRYHEQVMMTFNDDKQQYKKKTHFHRSRVSINLLNMCFEIAN